MIRVAINILLFLAPFIVYWFWLKYGAPERKERVPRTHVALLTAAGLVLGGLGFWLIGHGQGGGAGSRYIPAHMEDGRLVPGRFVDE